MRTNPGRADLDHLGLVGVLQVGIRGDVVVGGDLPLVEPAVGLREERDLDALVIDDSLEVGNLRKVQDAVAVQGGPTESYSGNLSISYTV